MNCKDCPKKCWNCRSDKGTIKSEATGIEHCVTCLQPQTTDEERETRKAAALALVGRKA